MKDMPTDNFHFVLNQLFSALWCVRREVMPASAEETYSPNQHKLRPLQNSFFPRQPKPQTQVETFAKFLFPRQPKSN